jgi:hypothetical protein
MQRGRASIPKVGLLGCFSLVKERKKSLKKRSEISARARDLQKTVWEFKTINSILMTQYCSHHLEISMSGYSHSDAWPAQFTCFPLGIDEPD